MYLKYFGYAYNFTQTHSTHQIGSWHNVILRMRPSNASIAALTKHQQAFIRERPAFTRQILWLKAVGGGQGLFVTTGLIQQQLQVATDFVRKRPYGGILKRKWPQAIWQEELDFLRENMSTAASGAVPKMNGSKAHNTNADHDGESIPIKRTTESVIGSYGCVTDDDDGLQHEQRL